MASVHTPDHFNIINSLKYYTESLLFSFEVQNGMKYEFHRSDRLLVTYNRASFPCGNVYKLRRQ